jgi:hypothetical protein
MGTEIEYEVVPKEQWISFGYKNADAIVNAACNAAKNKLSGKVINKYSSSTSNGK